MQASPWTVIPASIFGNNAFLVVVAPAISRNSIWRRRKARGCLGMIAQPLLPPSGSRVSLSKTDAIRKQAGLFRAPKPPAPRTMCVSSRGPGLMRQLCA